MNTTILCNSRSFNVNEYSFIECYPMTNHWPSPVDSAPFGIYLISITFIIFGIGCFLTFPLPIFGFTCDITILPSVINQTPYNSVCSPTIRIITFQVIDLGSAPGRCIYSVLFGLSWFQYNFLFGLGIRVSFHLSFKIWETSIY